MLKGKHSTPFHSTAQITLLIHVDYLLDWAIPSVVPTLPIGEQLQILISRHVYILLSVMTNPKIIVVFPLGHCNFYKGRNVSSSHQLDYGIQTTPVSVTAFAENVPLNKAAYDIELFSLIFN